MKLIILLIAPLILAAPSPGVAYDPNPTPPTQPTQPETATLPKDADQLLALKYKLDLLKSLWRINPNYKAGSPPPPINVSGGFVDLMNKLSAALQAEATFDPATTLQLEELSVPGVDFSQEPPTDKPGFGTLGVNFLCETSDGSPKSENVLKLADDLATTQGCVNYNTVGSKCFTQEVIDDNSDDDRAVIGICDSPLKYMPCNWIGNAVKALVGECARSGLVGGQIQFGKTDSQMRVLVHKGNIWS
jgi:hypothetical protein